MGLFDFKFNDEGGGIRIAPQWWVYFLVTVPLTIGTYIAFHIARDKPQKKGSESVGAQRIR